MVPASQRPHVVLLAVIVTLEVYSGRPDPQWELNDSEAAEFASRVAAAAVVGSSTTANDAGLGYRGFSVRAEDAGAGPYHVGSGRIVGGGQVRSDGSRALERWLLDTGRASLEPGLVAYVETQLTAKP